MEGLIDVLVELERVDEVLEGLIDELVLELGRAVLDDEELVETGFTEVGVLGLINPVDEVELFEVTLVTVELLELATPCPLTLPDPPLTVALDFPTFIS